MSEFLWLSHADDSIMSAIFWVMVILFVAAIYATTRAKRHHELSDAAWTRESAVEERPDDSFCTAWDRFSEAAPNLLLMVGLLGTFLSLALAIRHASDALNLLSAATPDSDKATQGFMEALQPLLENMGGKFKSSIWGIAGSLCLQVAVEQLCVKPRKAAIRRWRQRTAAALSTSQEDSRSAVVTQLVRALSKLQEEVHARGASQANHLQVIVHQFGALAQTASALQAAATLMDKSAQSLSASVQESESASRKTLESISQNLSRATQKMEATFQSELTRFSTTTDKQLAEMRMATTDASKSLKVEVSHLAAVMDVLKQENSRSSEATQTSFRHATDDLTTRVGGAITDMSRELSTTTDALRNQLATSLQSMKEGNEKTSTELAQTLSDSLKSFEASSTEASNSLKQEVSHLATVMDELKQENSRNSEETRSSFRHATNELTVRVGGAVTEMSSKLTTTTDALRNQLTTSLQSMKEANEKTSNKLAQTLSDSLKAFEASSSGSANALRSTLDSMKTELRVALSGMGSETSASLDGLRTSISSVEGSVVRLVRVASDMNATNEKIDDHIVEQTDVLNSLDSTLSRLRSPLDRVELAIRRSSATTSPLYEKPSITDAPPGGKSGTAAEPGT
jgi:hypothetical protein